MSMWPCCKGATEALLVAISDKGSQLHLSPTVYRVLCIAL